MEEAFRVAVLHIGRQVKPRPRRQGHRMRAFEAPPCTPPDSQHALNP